MYKITKSALDQLVAYVTRPAIPVSDENLISLQLGVERPVSGWKVVSLCAPTPDGPWRIFGEAPMAEDGGTSIPPNPGEKGDRYFMTEILGPRDHA
jgi:hypothetical protein